MLLSHLVNFSRAPDSVFTYIFDLELTEITTSQTTEDILANITRLTSENEVLDVKKQKLKEAAKSTDPEDLQLLNKQVEFTQGVWRKRKRQCMSILDSIGDGMDKKRSELIVSYQIWLSTPSNRN